MAFPYRPFTVLMQRDREGEKGIKKEQALLPVLVLVVFLDGKLNQFSYERCCY